MKKLMAMIFTVILLLGCEPGTHKPVYSDEGTMIHARKFTFEEHQYIEFKDDAYYGHGFVHDPDCWCMIDYD